MKTQKIIILTATFILSSLHLSTLGMQNGDNAKKNILNLIKTDKKQSNPKNSFSLHKKSDSKLDRTRNIINLFRETWQKADKFDKTIFGALITFAAYGFCKSLKTITRIGILGALAGTLYLSYKIISKPKLQNPNALIQEVAQEATNGLAWVQNQFNSPASSKKKDKTIG